MDDGVDGMWDLGEKVLTLEDVDGVGLLCMWWWSPLPHSECSGLKDDLDLGPGLEP